MTYPSAMKLAVALAVVVIVSTACSSGAEGPPAGDPTLEGVIVAIDSAAIDEVTSFTLKDGGDTYEIYIADDVEYGFPLGHMQEHLQGAEPVKVETETRDGKLYALTIEDV